MSSPDTSGYLKQWAEMRYIMERANAWNKYDSKKKAEVFDFAEQYRQFISKCKTERECVKEVLVFPGETTQTSAQSRNI